MNTAIKDNWQEANEAQVYNLADTSGRYFEENDYNTERCKFLQQQAAPHGYIEKFDGNPIIYQYFMSIFNEVVDDRIEDTRRRPIRLMKYMEGEPKELMKSSVQQPTHIGYRNAKMLLEK